MTSLVRFHQEALCALGPIQGRVLVGGKTEPLQASEFRDEIRKKSKTGIGPRFAPTDTKAAEPGT